MLGREDGSPDTRPVDAVGRTAIVMLRGGRVKEGLPVAPAPDGKGRG